MAYGKAGDWYVNNVEGGGGSSDFSTAKVTVVFNKSGTGNGKPTIYLPYLQHIEEEGESYNYIENKITDAGSYNVVIPSDSSVAGYIIGGLTVNVTSAEGDDEHVFIESGTIIITGSGTMTVNYTATGNQ